MLKLGPTLILYIPNYPVLITTKPNSKFDIQYNMWES